ncbi:nodulation outer protein NopT; probable type III effector (plasmid) [Sinorhizobium fredii NGR234]|uniref:Putative cysteine protease YopT-like y4zC n=1 Tax=Sinorhizobium fredii (strain NBRC 101917 / NGR234) TaxID=394 RepID=Y4ZC_SINFN|nr:RecName: Full=Putative cysteine protease YopT-like y4zC [Sinorhizobium fredii NGR234]AAB91961.1 nodulation outer protein NopT; probable type III effector [Sinorhizobium fredii NGR234]
MHSPISGSFTSSTQVHDPIHPANSDGFRETLANVELRTKSPSAECPDKMGCCASKPQASDPNNPSTSSPARPSTSLFRYRTAELAQANADGICVGLTAEWLRNLNSHPSIRMEALVPGSQRHASATVRQKEYENLKVHLRRQGAGPSEADFAAQNTMLQKAGLAPSGKEKVYKVGEPNFPRMLTKITADGSNHLLSLYFAEGGAHTVATSAMDGNTTLFDPNFGEFTVQSDQIDDLFRSLANRYSNPNRQHLTTVTTQKMT